MPDSGVFRFRYRCAASGVNAGDEETSRRIGKMTEFVAFSGKVVSGMKVAWNISAHAPCDLNSG